MKPQLLVLFLVVAVASSASADWTYYPLAESSSLITDVTPSGSYAAGFQGSNYFRWSVGGGFELVTGGSHSAGNAYISADGQYIAGEALNGSSQRFGARYSFASTSWTLAPQPPGYGNLGANFSSMWGMDDSGDVVALAAYDAGARYKPVSYAYSTNTHGLNTTQGATYHARPNDMSGDGLTMVGWDQVSGRNAAAWRGGVEVYFDAGVPGEIYGTTTDGSLHFGFRNNLHVWWDGDFVPTTLALPGGFDRGGIASGTDDGSMMVGYAQVGSSATSRRAVIWINDTPQLLSDWAAAHGMTFPNITASCVDISPDGSTIAGWRLDGSQKGFIMQIPEPGTLATFGMGIAALMVRSRRR